MPVSTWASVVRGHVRTDSYCDGEKARRLLWWSMPLRYGVQVFLGGYLMVACWRNNTYVGSGDGSEASTYTSPEGLQMTVHSAFPPWFLQVHRWSGLVLVVLVVLQKHLVPYLTPRSAAEVADGKQQPDGDSFLGSCESVRKAHVIVGYASLGAMGYMAACGFLMRSSSTFAGFHWAMILFVAPWVAFLVLIPWTVWKGHRVAHAMVGSAIFKSCVAVPLARTLGVVLQQLSGDPQTMGRDYYRGIALGAVLVGAWAIRDTIAMWRHMTGASGPTRLAAR